MNTDKPTLKLKLIINKDTKQFLFAEADKDFVDFLVNIPSLPIGFFLNLFQTEDHPILTQGSLGNIYDKIEDGSFILANKRQRNHSSSYETTFNYKEKLRYLGYDNVVPTKYMVMDDLTVEPMSLISSINRLDKLGVSASHDKIEEKEVNLGDIEVARLVKESLMTKNVITTVFLGNKYNTSG